MTDLRTRLAGVDPCCGSAHVDAQIVEVAAWLRERSTQCATNIGAGALLDAAEIAQDADHD